MVLQQLFRSLWLSAIAILLVECSFRRLYDIVARHISLDSHLNRNLYVSIRYEGRNHSFNIPLGSRSGWPPL